MNVIFGLLLILGLFSTFFNFVMMLFTENKNKNVFYFMMLMFSVLMLFSENAFKHVFVLNEYQFYHIMFILFFLFQMIFSIIALPIGYFQNKIKEQWVSEKALCFNFGVILAINTNIISKILF